MKEKFRDFFAKHRHLIVIALVFAIILAALTPLVVPLGLEVEHRFNLLPSRTQFPKLRARDIESCVITCQAQSDAAKEWRIFGLSTRTRPQEFDALCQALNEAPETISKHENPGGEICSIVLYPKTERARRFTLHYAGEKYSLVSTARNRRPATWYISEESAQALLSFCPCNGEPYDTPRSALCLPENITKAEFTVWVDDTYADACTLTPEQIETLCAFLEEHLIPLRVGATQHHPLMAPSGDNGWKVMFTMADGSAWRLVYGDVLHAPLLCYSETALGIWGTGLTYSGADREAFSALPELLTN